MRALTVVHGRVASISERPAKTTNIGREPRTSGKFELVKMTRAGLAARTPAPGIAASAQPPLPADRASSVCRVRPRLATGTNVFLCVSLSPLLALFLHAFLGSIGTGEYCLRMTFERAVLRARVARYGPVNARSMKGMALDCPCTVPVYHAFLF